MVTGQYLSKYFDNKIGQAYSGYLDTTKKNRLFKDAFLRIIESRYKSIPFQKSLDEEGYLNTTNATFAVNANQIYTAPLVASNIVVVSTTATVTTYLPHNLITGDRVTFSNVAGLTPGITGTFSVTVTGAKTFTITVPAQTGTYTANSGTFTSTNSAGVSNMISDYWHVLSLRARFTPEFYNLKVTGATQASPIVVTVDKYNNLRTEDNIVISGVVGNTNANGTFYIRKQNNFTFALYSDEHLQTPVSGTGAYVSGGTISKVFNNDAKPYLPKTKISVLNIPTPDKPRFENAERFLKIYPLNYVCAQIELDYVRQPDVFVDVADNVIDLSAYYPEKFLYHLTDVAAELFATPTRDPELERMQQQNIQENP